MTAFSGCSAFARRVRAGVFNPLFAVVWICLGASGWCGAPIHFQTDRAGSVSLNLYRADGSVARQLLTAIWMEAGDHEVAWDGLGVLFLGKAEAKISASLTATMNNPLSIRSMWILPLVLRDL